MVYDGEVKLDALSSFLKDAVHGGDTVIAMRQQVHTAVRQVEELQDELKRAKLEAAAKEDEAERLRAESDEQRESLVAQHEAQVAQLEARLQTLTQSSETELGRVAQSARVRLNEAEGTIETLQQELMSERASMTRQLELLRSQAADEVAHVRESFADARHADSILVAEIQVPSFRVFTVGGLALRLSFEV